MAHSDDNTGDTSAFKAPSNDAGLLPWLEKKRVAGKPRVSDLQMKLNLAYTLGQQWLVWDGAKKAFRRPSSRPNDPNAPVRVTVNKIGGLVERTASKLTKNVPIPECRPVGDQDKDVDAAKVGTRCVAHECSRIGWETMLADLYVSWVIPIGYSYLHICWDGEAGDTIGTVKEGKNDIDVHKGEIMVEIVPAFEMAVDPNARAMGDARWCIRTVSMTKEAVYEQYGKAPVGGENGKTIADEVVDLVEAGSGSSDRARDGFVKVHQFWLRPGGRVDPEGMVITWAGKTVLEDRKPFPYEHGRLPFVEFDLLPGIGTREGRTWVTDLIPIQTDYNDARSREAMIRRTLNPKLVAPVGSIDPNRVTSRVEVISYNPTGSAPQLLMPDGRWMAQHETAMNRADAEMGERAGQSDASTGDVPASMPAAAVLALQEADDTKLALSAKLLARSVQDYGWQLLMLVKQFWIEERIVRTWSEDSTIQVDHFTGTDLAHGFDVHVASESALPRSKAARTQMAVDLWTQGVITDPHMYVRLLNVAGTEFLADTLSVDQKHAKRENDKLRKGTTQEVHHWDNHSVHLPAHNDFRKSVEYEEMTPEARAVVDGHCAVHEMLALQQAGSPLPGTGPVVESPQTQPGLGNPEYLNSTTGTPNDPLAAAAGQAPSALEGSAVKKRAGIGGTGQPGEVPGVSTDTQAFRQGA